MVNIRPPLDVDTGSSGCDRRPVSRASYYGEDFVQIAVLATDGIAIGIPRSTLVTVLPLENLVFCSRGPHWLPGVAQCAGAWLFVLSISSWLRGVTIQPRLPAGLAVVSIGAGRSLGLVIDHAIGFRDLYPREVIVRPQSEASELVLGVTPDSLRLINLERVFADPALSGEVLRSYVLSER